MVQPLWKNCSDESDWHPPEAHSRGKFVLAACSADSLSDFFSDQLSDGALMGVEPFTLIVLEAITE